MGAQDTGGHEGEKAEKDWRVLMLKTQVEMQGMVVAETFSVHFSYCLIEAKNLASLGDERPTE